MPLRAELMRALWRFGRHARPIYTARQVALLLLKRRDFADDIRRRRAYDAEASTLRQCAECYDIMLLPRGALQRRAVARRALCMRRSVAVMRRREHAICRYLFALIRAAR